MAYLHLGQTQVCVQREIVGIFDIDTTSTGKRTREFFAAVQKRGEVINVTSEIPKSFILVCDKKKRQTVYISQISSATLKQRCLKMPR